MDGGDSTNEPASDAVLADYEAAGEDARYRDRLLYNSYYLAIIVLVFLAQLVATFLVNGASQFVPLVFFGGSVLYLFLTAWAIGVRRSRNNAWARREEIETERQDLKTNRYAALEDGPNQPPTVDQSNDDSEETGTEDGEKSAEENSEDDEDERTSLEIAVEYAKENHSLSDIPDIVHLLDPDLVSWFLLPVTALLLFLGVATSLAELWSGVL